MKIIFFIVILYMFGGFIMRCLLLLFFKIDNFKKLKNTFLKYVSLIVKFLWVFIFVFYSVDRLLSNYIIFNLYSKVYKFAMNNKLVLFFFDIVSWKKLKSFFLLYIAIFKNFVSFYFFFLRYRSTIVKLYF